MHTYSTDQLNNNRMKKNSIDNLSLCDYPRPVCYFLLQKDTSIDILSVLFSLFCFFTSMLPTIIVSVLLGIVVGYAIFYFRYDNRHFIDELRNNLANARQDLENASADAAEFEQQNIILRDKVTSLITKNDDLSKIVSDLSR